MPRLVGIAACVFDAYGTLFDVNAAAAACAAELGAKWQPLAELWRQKQLQYSWLRTLMGRHADFWRVTGDALDFAMEQLGLADDGLRRRLMALYLELAAYPEVKPLLGRLQAAGLKTAILSNGSPPMLEAAVASAGLGDRLDALISVEEVGAYKTDPRVYARAEARLGLHRSAMLFLSSNGWDAAAAAEFGWPVVWVNRSGQPRERLGGTPAAVIARLDELPPLLGLA